MALVCSTTKTFHVLLARVGGSVKLAVSLSCFRSSTSLAASDSGFFARALALGLALALAFALAFVAGFALAFVAGFAFALTPLAVALALAVVVLAAVVFFGFAAVVLVAVFVCAAEA